MSGVVITPDAFTYTDYPFVVVEHKFDSQYAWPPDFWAVQKNESVEFRAGGAYFIVRPKINNNSIVLP